jgi:hypothetical protein
MSWSVAGLDSDRVDLRTTRLCQHSESRVLAPAAQLRQDGFLLLARASLRPAGVSLLAALESGLLERESLLPCEGQRVFLAREKVTPNQRCH